MTTTQAPRFSSYATDLDGTYLGAGHDPRETRGADFDMWHIPAAGIRPARVLVQFSNDLDDNQAFALNPHADRGPRRNWYAIKAAVRAIS